MYVLGLINYLQLPMARDHFKVVHVLARYGAISIGVVYILIGTIAMLSLLGLKDGGADEDSLLESLHSTVIGSALLWIILLGMLSYIIWRFYEAIADPYECGTSLKGVAKRLGAACSAIAYGTIALSAIQAMLNLGDTGEGFQEQQNLIADILQWRRGQWIIGVVGLVVGVAGLMEFKYVIKGDHRPLLDINHLSKIKCKIIYTLAWIGHFARGIILLIIAYSLFRGAITNDARETVNTDKAFNFIGESLLGHPLFVVVAVGTMCYGVFMILFGLYLDFDKD